MYQANNMQQLRFMHNIPDIYYIYLSYSQSWALFCTNLIFIDYTLW